MGSESIKQSPHSYGARARAQHDTAADMPAASRSDTTTGLVALLGKPLSDDELGWLAHYRVLKILGRGGMGVVFQAEDSHLQRRVALKVILPEFAAETIARERFLREARTAAALKNDHIVTVYQVGQDRDVPYLAMEYLEGESLENRLVAEAPLPLPEAVRIAREIATGLAAAHAQGLIHRDIKPANVWLEKAAVLSGGGAVPPRVKLLDFGLARAVRTESALTRTGGIVGTPEFMSPEQARGLELDARSDLFSLGAVLYAMCSGQVPFQGNSVMAVLTALAIDTPRPVRELNPDVPPALADLIDQLLQKDPAKRPASADEVRLALAAVEAPLLPAGPQSCPRLPLTRSATAPVVARLPRWLVPVAAFAGVLLIAGIGYFAGWTGHHHEELAEAAVTTPALPARTPAVPSGEPIRIGVLHSLTGTMAISERPVIDAVQLAVEEINRGGGLLGRPVKAIVADGESDEDVFAARADQLIRDDKVVAIFGCWTSSSRKAVVPIVETKHNHLLVYPVQYEGVEQSPNVFYLGPTPAQQIVPALQWLSGFQYKRRWFLVGSDYVFPRTANEIIRAEAKKSGCDIVGEKYLKLQLDPADVAPLVKDIADARPDLIVNTINGDANVAFFRALRRAGIRPEQIPTVSFSISVQERNQIGLKQTAGDYVAASYFQSLDTPANKDFVERVAQHYGSETRISSPMAAAYAGVHLWAQAVKAAGSADVHAVRAALKGQELDAPQGRMRIDPATQHTLQLARIGQIDANGTLVEEFFWPQPKAPEPFPPFKSPSEWNAFLSGLHKGWGGHWSAQ